MQGFKLKTAQVQSQKQVLSAQMQQLIKLLPLSATELQSRIQQEVEENPALEIPDFGSGLTLDEPSALSGDSDFWEDDSPPSGKGSSDSEISSDVYIDPRSTKVGKTLKQYLREQLDVENLSDEEKLCGEEIIQALDENGFLKISRNEINPGISFEVYNKVLKIIRDFDPPGIAQKDSKSALLFQISRLDSPPPHTMEIVENYFDALRKPTPENLVNNLKKNYSYKITIPEAEKVLECVLSLNPLPGSGWSGKNPPQYVIPDVKIHVSGNRIRTELVPESFPVLKTSPDFKKEAEKAGEKDRGFFSEKISQAELFIQRINLRNETLEKVINYIVLHQKAFFLFGSGNLKPLSMGQVAKDLGFSESTISRTVSSKYLECDWGIIPLRFFFTNGVGETKNLSSEMIKGKIALIMKESEKLTDEKIRGKLEEQGISISRRTVAKYRKELQDR